MSLKSIVSAAGALVFATICVSNATVSAATLQDALDAYRNNHIAQAEPLLTAIATDATATPANRAEAERELGRIAWLAHGDVAPIAQALARTPAGDESCVTATLALRIYREGNQPAQILRQAEPAQTQCAADHADAMHTQLARTHLALAAALSQDRARELAAAAHDLNAVRPAALSTPEAAGARLSLALAQRDSDASLIAWRGYFWLTDSDAPQAMHAYAGRVGAVLKAGLAPSASDADIIALITMLIDAGFTDDARLLASQTNVASRAGQSPAWLHAAAYFTFDQAVRDATLRANREMIAGGKAIWFGDAIRAAMTQLMTSVGLSGDPRTALAAAYGLYGALGETGGYPSLHGGHLVEDRHLDVAQYGRHGQLRFIVIDNMISNGYESWLWDGWAEAGGWSGDDGIVQVRSAYTDGPLSALDRARPGPARDRFIAHIAAATAAERASLANGAIAVLPATGDRLFLQAIDQMAARTGADDTAFIAENWRATVQYSIELHEGRHALDKAEGEFSDADLEFRAKLSQIRFADYPKLGLSNVVNATIGDTPHGTANRRVLEGYRTWVETHRREISGYDQRIPALAQLDKLTDDQVRAAAGSLDPWANAGR